MLEFCEGKDFVNANALFKRLRLEHDEATLKKALGRLVGRRFIEAESQGSIRFRITETGQALLVNTRKQAAKEERANVDEKTGQLELRALQAEALVYQKSIRTLEKDLKEEQLKGAKAQRRYNQFRVFWAIGGALVTYIAGKFETIIQALYILRTWLGI